MSDLQKLIGEEAENILQEVDYDIYKEDLEEREILECLEIRLKDMLIDICDRFTLDGILDFVQR